MMAFLIALVAISHLGIAYGRSDGTIPSSACSTMQPGHGVQPQTTESPYYVAVETVHFVENIVLRVFLEGPAASPPFKGFYCQARTSSSAIVGEFKIYSDHSTGHRCNSQQGVFDTISHSSSWSQNPKRHVTVHWKTSAPLDENVTIRCTFVQTFSIFWVGVESLEILPIRSTNYTECCATEWLYPEVNSLCKNILEPAQMDAFTILKGIANGVENATSSFVDIQSALRCSYWSQPGRQLLPSVLHGCCVSENVTDDCMTFCNKNTFAAMNYPLENLTTCLSKNPNLGYCILQPVQGSSVYPTNFTTTDEYGEDMLTTNGMETSGAYVSTTTNHGTSTTTDHVYEDTTATTVITETTSDVFSTKDLRTSRPQSPTTIPSESPGRAVFTITSTVQVEGAMEDKMLRMEVFTALESDLLTPALQTVLGFLQVRTGVAFSEGSLVVSSEGVYEQQSDGTVPSTNDISSAINVRLGEINDSISNGFDVWAISRPVLVAHKSINGNCQTASCSGGTTCVEVGPDASTCICETNVCDTTDSGLSTGALVGIIIGAILVIVIIGIIVFVLRRRRSLFSKQKREKRYMSARSNHTYEDPIYMDISSAEVKPPTLPPDRNVGNLPSNSLTYETPVDDKKGKEVLSFRKISQGYVIGVTEEGSQSPTKPTGEYGYATYDAKKDTLKKIKMDHEYDDQHLKTEPSENSTKPNVENERSVAKQEVATYESLS